MGNAAGTYYNFMKNEAQQELLKEAERVEKVLIDSGVIKLLIKVFWVAHKGVKDTDARKCRDIKKKLRELGALTRDGKVPKSRRRRVMERLLRYENHYSSGAEGYPPR